MTSHQSPDPTDPRVPDEDKPLLHSARRRSPLAGWGDANAHWTVPVAIGLFSAALLFTLAYVPRWQLAGAGGLLAAAAIAAHLAMRPDGRYALPAGLVALVTIAVALVLFFQTPL